MRSSKLEEAHYINILKGIHTTRGQHKGKFTCGRLLQTFLLLKRSSFHLDGVVMAASTWVSASLIQINVTQKLL